MAYTIAEDIKLNKSESSFRNYVLRNILEYSPAMEYIPWESVDKLMVEGVRWKTLPSVARRAVGEGYTASQGAVEEVYESLYGYGGDINFDRVFELTKGSKITDPIQLQIDMKMMAMGYMFNYDFINGDPAVNPKGIMGLKARAAVAPSSQKVGFAGDSATGLDATASDANGLKFFNTLNAISENVNKGDHDMWLTNKATKMGIGVVARKINLTGGGFLDVTKDSLGREFPTLYGSPIVNIGKKKDQSTEIIPLTETAGDSGADSTSIYCAAFNDRQGLMGAQLEPLKAYDPLNGGEQESTPSKLRRIDWWIGLVAMGSYGLARGWNLHDPTGWTVPAVTG